MKLEISVVWRQRHSGRRGRLGGIVAPVLAHWVFAMAKRKQMIQYLLHEGIPSA